jgi:thiamine biosynthesis lipoprotein
MIRRPRLTVRALLAVIACGMVAVASTRLRAADEPGQTRWFKYLMGTAMRVEAYGGTAADRQQAADEAFAAIAEVDRLMSDYRDDSELAAINRGAAHGAVPVSAPVMAVLQAAAHVSRASDGAFDVTVGPLVRLWGFKDKRPHLPSAAELAAVRPLVDYRAVVLDDSAGTVRFARDGVSIDLGGIAKGFAVELAAGSLKRRGLAGVIDAGGNQYVVGVPAGKAAWTIGISDPDRRGKLLGVVNAAEGAISTSSDASNFLVAGERRYGHLLDPRTLAPSEAALSVTILSPDGTLSDALSKAVFVLGPRRGLELLASFPGAAALVAFREPDGKVGIAMSPAFKRVFQPIVG